MQYVKTVVHIGYKHLYQFFDIIIKKKT